LAVDAQLTFADDALDVGERQAGKARLEKTVDAHVVFVGGDDHGLDFGRQLRRLGNDLLRLRNERLRRAWRRGRKARRLATGAMNRRAIGLSIAIRASALRAISWRSGFCEWPFDAAAHPVFPNFLDVGRPARRGNIAICAPTSFSAKRSSW